LEVIAMSSRTRASRPPATFALLVPVCALLLVVASSAMATTYTWNNAGGGSWSTAANWTPSGVPSASGDVAVLPALSGAYAVSLDADPAIAAVELENGPILDLGAHSLVLAEALTNDGTIRVPTGSVVQLAKTAQLGGTGTVILEGGTLATGEGVTLLHAPGHTITGCGTISGTIDNQGVIDLDCAEIQVASLRGRLTNRNRIALRGGNLTFDGTQVVNEGTIRGGNGAIRMQNGALIHNTPAATLVAGRGHFYTGVRGAASVIEGGTLEIENKGAFKVSGDTYTDDVILSTDATLTVMRDAKIWAHGPAFRLRGVNEVLPGGVFIVSPTTSYVDDGGTTILAGGRLVMPAGYRVRGTLSGSGTVIGAVVNEGIIRPDISTGGLVFQGDYLQAPTGRLGLGIAGPEVGQFARLTVSGAATLDGTVAVESAGGFLPAEGQDFPVMAFASRKGQFASVEAAAGLGLDPEYSDAGVTLRTKATVGVPEPIALPAVLAFTARGTAFRLDLPEPADVSVRAYDVRGREVAVLLDERLPAGTYPITLSGRNLPSGVVFARASVRTAAGNDVRSARVAFIH
jgi:hypothetical protein